MKNPSPIFGAFGVASMLLLQPGSASAAVGVSPREAEAAMHRAIEFFRTKAGYQGAYLYRYSADLEKQEGEGRAARTAGWVEPPGTPSVGLAYLKAWQLTGDAKCREAAVEAGHALVRSQLHSGGWDSGFDLGEGGRKRHAYRVDGPAGGKKRNLTTLDDNKTQSALRFLMLLDEALGFQDDRIHEAVEYCVKHLLAAQYPNGAWPQRFAGPPDPKKHPVRRASYPDSWPREWPKEKYYDYYTFNDNTIADVVDVLLLAHAIYGREECRKAALRTGDFILLAQMPEPQPGWCQQYNPDMHPAWARKFEPAAITGGESQGVMEILMRLYSDTGERRFLEPIPRALAYYQASLLPDGRLARFYELKTNKPLYFTKDYQLTYRPDDMPTHYAFIVSSKLDRIESRFRKLAAADPSKFGRPSPVEDRRPRRPRLSSGLEKRAAEAVARLDGRGAWVEKGKLRYHGDNDPTREIIESRTFASHLGILAEYIAAAKGR